MKQRSVKKMTEKEAIQAEKPDPEVNLTQLRRGCFWMDLKCESM
jgi:hypothetical protein